MGRRARHRNRPRRKAEAAEARVRAAAVRLLGHEPLRIPLAHAFPGIAVGNRVCITGTYGTFRVTQLDVESVEVEPIEP